MYGGKLVRETQFERVTDLQLSTVCQTANDAREKLSALFGRALTIDVFGPVILQRDSYPVLFDGTFFVATGTLCDAYVVFRERDGHRLAATAFGEDPGACDGPLSPLEARALERVAEELLSQCTPFCGAIDSVTRSETAAEPPACVTYFELRLAEPIDAVIGIGLSKDPGLDFGANVDRAMLADVALDVRAEFAETYVDAREIARWRVGSTVRLDTKIGDPTVLKIGSFVIASGDCGIRAQNNAVSITASPFEESAR